MLIFTVFVFCLQSITRGERIFEEEKKDMSKAVKSELMIDEEEWEEEREFMLRASIWRLFSQYAD